MWMEEMSESEPSRTHRYCLKELSKPELTIGSGISWDEACLRAQRQPVYILVGWHGLIDHAQEPQPLLMSVFLLTQSEDLAVGDIQRGKQGGCAVALVVGRHGCATAGL